MTDETLILGGLPAPGEPLTEHVDSDNQDVLNKDIQYRADLLRARLKNREYARLTRRMNKLHALLNRRGYNRLITRRADVWAQYQTVAEAYKRNRTDHIKKKGEALANEGKTLNEQIAKLLPTHEEYEQIRTCVEAHERLLSWEKEDAENRAAFFREADVWEAQINAVFRRSPRLRHVHKERDGRERIQTPIIERVICKEDKVYFQIRSTYQNILQKWFKLWDWAIPEGVDRRDLICDETLENLSLACGRVVTAEINKKSQNVMYVVSRLDSADGIPNKVLFSQVIDFYPEERHPRTPWVGGVTTDRKIMFFDFEDYPHMLIGGETGGGKSNFLNQLICTLIMYNKPDELRLVLIDLKRGMEFSSYKSVPHLLMPVVKRIDDVLPALKYIRQMMEQRQDAFDDVARDLATFNARVKEKIPRVVVVIDEMATLIGLGPLTEQIHSELRVLTSQARAVGIHIVVCTQHPTVDVIPNWAKVNLLLRIAMRTVSIASSQVIIGSIGATLLPDVRGRAVFRLRGDEIPAQVPLIDDAAIARAIAFAKKHPAPPDAIAIPEIAVAPAPLDVRPKFSRENLLDIALDEFGGKLSPTRTHEKVGNDVMPLAALRKMVNGLVDEIEANGGILIYRNGQYKLSKDRKAHVLKRIESIDTPNEPTSLGYSTEETEFDYSQEGELQTT